VTRTAKPPKPWWSSESPPWETWPGVSLRLEAAWCAKRRRWESADGKYYFDADAADGACDSFENYLRHTKGEFAGRPFVLLPWQADLIVRPLFGWKRCRDGHRRFRKIFVEVAKKAGKSGLASGLGLLLAFGDGEPGAEVYAVAADRDQARIVFGDAKSMARENPEFLADAGIEVLQNAIVQTATNSTFKALSAEVGTKHGFNVHGLIFDEFHTQRSRDLYDALYKGTSARRQPVIFIITTAGDDRESICYEEYSYAKNVRDGVIPDEQYLPVVFEPGPDDDWTDEATWRKANPSLGVTKSVEYMRAECEAAQAEPRKRNSFLRLDLNRWTESRTVWISPESWEACKREEKDPERMRTAIACAGLDLSSTTDLTALVVACRRPDHRMSEQIEVDPGNEKHGHPRRVLTLDFSVDVQEWFWLPREVLRERTRRDRVPYDVWARDGWLRVTDGDMVDYRAIHETLDREVRANYQLGETGFDPWNAQQLALALQDDGFKMVEVRQGYGSLSAPAKLFEALVRAKRITYSGSPLMRWCVANCEVSSDAAGNIKPVKPSGAYSATRRIDGVVATLIALQRLMLAPEPRRSVYADRGILVIGR